MKALVALAIVAGLGWLGYDRLFKDDPPKVPAPVQVNVETPQPFGGEPPSDDRIYVP
jgi:hypothetical protein